ncbi:MAG: hypothetical protein ACREBS_06765 [Nitrososphaerales archaeon]
MNSPKMHWTRGKHAAARGSNRRPMTIHPRWKRKSWGLAYQRSNIMELTYFYFQAPGGQVFKIRPVRSQGNVKKNWAIANFLSGFQI